MLDDITELKQQRDELLEALIYLLHEAKEVNATNEHAWRYIADDAIENAQAAIAKAKETE